MELMNIQNPENDELSQHRRDFLNAIFGLLKALSIHDLENGAVQRPKENLEKLIHHLSQFPQAKNGVEIKLQEGLLTIMGGRVNNHFSIVEASKQVPEHMDIALIESILFEPSVKMATVGEFFSKWALHCSVHKKPRALVGSFSGIQLSFIDPEKENLRVKSKQLLLSPTYALNHYYILHKSASRFFKGISSGEIISQRQIRRELLEMAEIGKVNPYQLVALSLIRELDFEEEEGDHAAVAEAIATAVLSMVIGKELEFSIRDQVNLGMVGLMYNVGLLSNEMASLLKSDKRLSQVEYKRVLNAQASGVYKLLRSHGASRPALERLLALFEATQGNYKKSISLNLDSRLLRLTSAYIALTSHRPYRDAYTPEEAMRLLGSRATSKREGNLDPIIYYVFVRFMGIYPVGSLVLLSDQRKAVIYRPSGQKAGVPLIKLVGEKSDEASTLVDLSTEPNLSIIKALDPKREGDSIPGYFFD